MVIAVVVVASASLAFACTTYQGKMQVTAGGATSISQGDDNCNHSGGCGFGNGSMTFCGTVTLAAHVPHTGGTATVSTGTTDSCTGTGQIQNHLAANKTFDINIARVDSMSASDLTIDNNEDCMTWNVANGVAVKLGTATTDANGAFTVSNLNVGSKAAANSTGWYAGLCISDSTSDYGNQAGIRYT
jgi:hypothetical protein